MPSRTRRHWRAYELLSDVTELKSEGETNLVIATRLGLTSEYVRQIVHLATLGDLPLLAAIKGGSLPLSVGLEIAKLSDPGLRTGLHRAYEGGQVKGDALKSIRIALSRGLPARTTNPEPDVPSPDDVGPLDPTWLLLESARYRADKARASRARLDQLKAVFSQLLDDPEFALLLVEQGFVAIPELLVQGVAETGDLL